MILECPVHLLWIWIDRYAVALWQAAHRCLEESCVSVSWKHALCGEEEERRVPVLGVE